MIFLQLGRDKAMRYDVQAYMQAISSMYDIFFGGELKTNIQPKSDLHRVPTSHKLVRFVYHKSMANKKT